MDRREGENTIGSLLGRRVFSLRFFDSAIVIYEYEWVDIFGVGIALGSFVARTEVALCLSGGLIRVEGVAYRRVVFWERYLGWRFLLASVGWLAGIRRFVGELTAMVSWFDVERRVASYPAVGCICDERCRRGLLQAYLRWRDGGRSQQIQANQLSMCRNFVSREKEGFQREI